MRGRARGFAAAVVLAMGVALALSIAALADTSQWTVVAGSIDVGANGAISSVSCAGTTCWAVGGQSSITAGQPAPALLEGNTGNGWFIAADPSPDLENGLNGVTCVDAGDCWAVGSGTPDQTLIDQYVNGAWAFESSPALLPPDPYREAELDGVACTSLTDCWAVGGDGDPGSPGRTLIEHYNGADWAVVSGPNIGSKDNYLNSVACPASNDCWAVGSANTDAPLVEHYDGTAWTVDTNLADVGSNNVMNGVTCVSTAECWAVGYQGDSIASFTQTVIEQYDGNTWSRVSSPDPLGGEWGVNYLKGVSCDSTGACWAVGQSEGVEGIYSPGQSLIAEYTGSGGWVAVTNPDPGLSSDDFTSVGCGIASCIAGGQTGNPGSPLLAQGPLGKLSEGGTTGGSSGSGGTTSSDPSVPDTGGTGAPWAPLVLAGGASLSAAGCALRRRRMRDM